MRGRWSTRHWSANNTTPLNVTASISVLTPFLLNCSFIVLSIQNQLQRRTLRPGVLKGCNHGNVIGSTTKTNTQNSIIFSSLGIVIHDTVRRYEESIWTGESPRQAELITCIGNLETDLLAGEGGWVTNRLCVGQSEVNGTMHASVSYYINSLAYHKLYPQRWYLQFRWNVNSTCL